MLARTRNLGVAASGQVLEHVDEVVLRGVRHVLDVRLIGRTFAEIVLRHFQRRNARIVYRGIRHFGRIGLRGGRRDDRIGQLAVIGVDNQRIKLDFAALAGIPIMDRNRVDIDRLEDRDDPHVAGDFRIRGDFRLRALQHPLLEDLAFHEGVLRHGADLFAFHTEELVQALLGAVVVLDDEADLILRLESRGNCQIRGDFLSALILGFTDEPADELLAFDNRLRRQLQRVSAEVGVAGVYFIVHLKGDGKSVSLILRPDVGIRRDPYGVAEVAAVVDPLAGSTGLGGNGGDVVQAIAGVNINRLLRYLSALALIRIEGDGVGNLVIIRNDGGILGRDIRGIDPLLDVGRSMVVDRADGPVRIVITALNGRGHLVADGFALYDLDHLVHFAVAVVEGDRPGLNRVLPLCNEGCIFGNRIGSSFYLYAISTPVVKFLPFLRCCRRRRQLDGRTVLDQPLGQIAGTAVVIKGDGPVRAYFVVGVLALPLAFRQDVDRHHLQQHDKAQQP